MAVSPNGQLAAAVGLGPEVFVWDLAGRRETGSFKSIFEFGGRRLAISDTGLVVAAAYHRQGIACYDSTSGSLVWSRKDLTKVQRVSMSASSQFVYVCFDERPCKVLWTSSGYTAFNIRGARMAFDSAYGPVALLDKKIPQIASQPGWKGSFNIDRFSFAILDASFSPSEVAITESGGPVRGFDLSTGRERWRYQRPGCHIRRVAYSDRLSAFFGVEWSYRRSGNYTLIRIDSESGEPSEVCNLGPGLTAEFCLGADAVLKSDGDVVDVASGASIGAIALRQSETTRES
jgi:outer membrane protein assembly factor BamB